MRIASTTLALIGLSLSAAAHDPFFSPGNGVTIPWSSGSWGVGTVTRIHTCDFNGDLYLDAMVLDGGDLIYTFGPGTFTSRTAIASGVNDFAVLPGASPLGKDALIVSNAGGVSTVHLDIAVTGHVVTTAVSTGAWAGAHDLTVLTPSGQTPIVFAINAARTKILRLTDPFGAMHILTERSLPAGTVGLALALVDWDGAGQLDLAVLHDEGLLIYDQTIPSTPMDSFTLASSSAPLSGGDLAGVRQVPGAPTRVAALVQPASSGAELWIFDENEVESDLFGMSSPLESVLEPYALAAGDLDGDGDDDLIVAHRDDLLEGPVICPNLCQDTGTSCDTFSMVQCQEAPGGYVGLDWSLQQVLPAVGDFTGDGDVDLAWFQQDAAEFWIAESAEEEHSDQYIQVSSEGSRVLKGPNYPADESVALSARFLAPLQGPAFTPDTILVEEWYAETPGPPSAADPTLHYVGVQSIQFAYPTSSPQWGNRHSLYLWPAFVPTSNPIYLTVRAARTVSGEVVEAGPAATFVFVLNDDLGESYQDDLGLSMTGLSWFDFSGLSYPTISPVISSPGYSDSGYVPSAGNNGSEGGDGGAPPRPPPDDDGGDPPINPTNP